MRFLERRPGRAAGEERVVLGTDDGRVAGRGLWFSGRPASGLRPWADLVLQDLTVLPEVARELGPGASIMVAYEGDETQATLRRGVPPAATPTGLALLRAGCRWFKDWYYPEGGREGGTKLQGTIPLDPERARSAGRAVAEEIRAFLHAGRGSREDRERSREALRLLEPGPDPLLS